ncbi:putative UDP-glucose flavonoid 3-O-glucosyltransferase 3 [Rosa chinensis]|uniref:Glycosyltransferase n=1 Tax=Rosa chinensis TaxID=74649 RepID=A0A2P6S0R3_ROSCH|nr:putative UDP-glucose flavonoid 3-O-glucosyltransferase 3 [Rosa chinensis]PRQ52253.1 putative UDP-glucose flavonoid 3-O-glucosyltransferase 3 [Rosa chinensis]
MEKPAELVFIPSPGIGHLVSTLEIAKFLLSRDDQLLITVLIMKFPAVSKGTDAYVESFADSSSPISQRIKFINLPQVNTDHTEGSVRNSLIGFVESQQPHVKDAITKLSESQTRLAGFVVDMFCTAMIDVADQFGVPSYVFFTSSAAALGLMLHVQALRDQEGKDCTEFKDSDAELLIPSFVNPLPAAKVLPGRLFVKEGAESFLNIIKRFRDTKGILVNTFADLESHALHALSSDAVIPPVYPVGPLLNLNTNESSVDSDEAKQKSDILKWLDDQPPLSVVFLCFGSMGSFGEDQVKEIAHALEQAGHRFLWSLRRPPPTGKIAFPSDYDDHTGVLPKGFLDRTVGIGKVIGWAPQVAVLAHPSVGGFVSHCGWNSTLESLWHGVPVATWPLYAEQQLNAFQLVEELELAVEIDMSYRSESPVLVSAKEIERGIREVMKRDNDIRNRVKEMSEKGKKALMDGGSSYSSVGQFIDQI